MGVYFIFTQNCFIVTANARIFNPLAGYHLIRLETDSTVGGARLSTPETRERDGEMGPFVTHPQLNILVGQKFQKP